VSNLVPPGMVEVDFVPLPTRLRMLKRDERIGVVSVPIVLYSYYFPQTAWSSLLDSGAQVAYSRDSVVWSNPLLVGLSSSMVTAENTTVLAAFTSLHRSYIWRASTAAKGTRLLGPIRHSGNHFYVLAIPELLLCDVEITSWNFLMKSKERIPVHKES